MSRIGRLVPPCSVVNFIVSSFCPESTENCEDSTVVGLPLSMEPFSIDAFVTSPSVRVVKSLKKSDFILVAQHYKLEVSSVLRKSEIKK